MMGLMLSIALSTVTKAQGCYRPMRPRVTVVVAPRVGYFRPRDLDVLEEQDGYRDIGDKVGNELVK